MRCRRVVLVALTGLLSLAACSQSNSSAKPRRPKIGFITNGTDAFWRIAHAGIADAAEKFDVDYKFATPKGGVPDQKSELEDMVSAGYQGIAISPLEPDNQTDLLNRIAAKTHLITQDSDAPRSKRLCFIGVDNYAAGRLCGKLVKEAIPDGGKVMLFVGSLDQDNAAGRRQGVIDEVFGRSVDPKRRDPNNKPVTAPGSKFVILGCLTDGQQSVTAKNNAEDTLTNHPDLACMVGLFAYNPPTILEALRRAGKLGKIKVVGFDERAETLQAIRDGMMAGTVVQDPYRYGYESIRLLAAVSRGDRSVLPAGGVLPVPAKVIRRGDVDAFQKELEARLGRK